MCDPRARGLVFLRGRQYQVIMGGCWGLCSEPQARASLPGLGPSAATLQRCD